MSETLPSNLNRDGAFANREKKSSGSIGEILEQAIDNFLNEDIEPVEGLSFNQYDLLRTINLYINSRFEGGPTDSRGNDKFFHNIINHRCAHATKNIDLDTKDIYVSSDDERGQAASFIMRAKLRCWMRDTGFADKLNRLGDNLPKYGAVIWKRVIRDSDSDNYPDTVDVEDVPLLDVVFDPTVKRIKESQIFAHRMTMKPNQLSEKVDKGLWNKDAVDNILKTQKGGKSTYIKNTYTGDAESFSLVDSIPVVEMWEMYGYFPETSIPSEWLKEAGLNEKDELSDNRYVYLKVILDTPKNSVGGTIVFLKKQNPKDFPYKDCLLPMRASKRWLPLSIAELLIDLQVRANELIYRFFNALRSGSLHYFQTRNGLAQGNLFNDAEDGDIIVSKGDITPIPLELRAFSQYQTELQNIESQADKIANTFEVVTGENLPTNTPFRLGAQLSASAGKIYDQMREECGNFLSEVFNDWILPEIADSITPDEIIDIIGSADELKAFDDAYKNFTMVEAVKQYILKNSVLPTQSEFEAAEKIVMDGLSKSGRKTKITSDFLNNFLKFSIRFDVTGETTNKKANDETLGNLFQIIASNPAVMQDPTAKMLLGRIMEASGISPIQYLGSLQTPKPQSPDVLPGQASPAQKTFGSDKSTSSIGQKSAEKVA